MTQADSVHSTPPRMDTNAIAAMRRFDALPAPIRSALHDEPTNSVPAARGLVKRMGVEAAAKHISERTAFRLQMQQTLTQTIRLS
jgi:hypothetical protein